MDFKKMSAIAAIMLLAACGDNSSSSAPENNKEGATIDINKMTLREKVGQMFFIRPEALDTSIHWNEYAELPDYKLQHVNKTMLAINKACLIVFIVIIFYGLMCSLRQSRCKGIKNTCNFKKKCAVFLDSCTPAIVRSALVEKCQLGDERR